MVIGVQKGVCMQRMAIEPFLEEHREVAWVKYPDFTLFPSSDQEGLLFDKMPLGIPGQESFLILNLVCVSYTQWRRRFGKTEGSYPRNHITCL